MARCGTGCTGYKAEFLSRSSYQRKFNFYTKVFFKSMKEILNVIRALSKHNFRSISNVVGEYVEKVIAETLNGVQANHCQRGYDLIFPDLGKVEVKSRNAEARSLQCTLPPHKLEEIDNFILAIVRHGEIEKVLLFSRLCCAIQSKGALPLTPDGFIPRAPSRACPAA